MSKLEKIRASMLEDKGKFSAWEQQFEINEKLLDGFIGLEKELEKANKKLEDFIKSKSHESKL